MMSSCRGLWVIVVKGVGGRRIYATAFLGHAHNFYSLDLIDSPRTFGVRRAGENDRAQHGRTPKELDDEVRREFQAKLPIHRNVDGSQLDRAVEHGNVPGGQSGPFECYR